MCKKIGISSCLIQERLGCCFVHRQRNAEQPRSSPTRSTVCHHQPRFDVINACFPSLSLVAKHAAGLNFQAVTIADATSALRHPVALASSLQLHLRSLNNQLTTFHLHRAFLQLSTSSRKIQTDFVARSLPHPHCTHHDGGNPSKACHCRRRCLREDLPVDVRTHL